MPLCLLEASPLAAELPLPEGPYARDSSIEKCGITPLEFVSEGLQPAIEELLRRLPSPLSVTWIYLDRCAEWLLPFFCHEAENTFGLLLATRLRQILVKHHDLERAPLPDSGDGHFEHKEVVVAGLQRNVRVQSHVTGET